MLRVTSALLLTLESYQRCSRRTRTPVVTPRVPTMVTVTRPTTAMAVPAITRPTTAAAVPAATTPAIDAELAASTASYIARDLVARQLTEFTSAEGYRLARALAAVGDVSETVEQLLARANTVRLHPVPLTEALSHRAG